MFKLEELSGSLIRSGRFKEAIPVLLNELFRALKHGVISEDEMRNILTRFGCILLNPSDMVDVRNLSESMLRLVLRIPGYVPTVSYEEFDKNVKASRETK